MTPTVYLLLLSFTFAVSLVVIRVMVRRDYLRRGRLSVGSATLQALVFVICGAFPAIFLPADWPNSHVYSAFVVLGVASIIGGLANIFLGMFRLGILRSLGLRKGVLEKTGNYRVTRNPQVLGCVLYVIGFVLLWPSWYALSWGLSLMATIHIMVLTEEENLRNTFGQDYEQYCNRVPRYLGFPRRR